MQKVPKLKDQISDFLTGLPNEPGIYQFLDNKKNVIYVGKARNIKNRVRSYFQSSQDKNSKTLALIDEINFLDLTITNNELEALLIEQRRIKELKPKFNIQFKDDKGYPWIKVETSKEFPSAKSFLGRKGDDGRYFGPYPSSHSVRDVLNLIQKNFKLRNCSDSFFKNRTRPCIQYEIERCSAPCVQYISKNDYLKEVNSAELLLEGKSNKLFADLNAQMDKFSKNKFYEKAALSRDKISALRDIQRNQSIAGFNKERDAIAVSSLNGITKVGITHVRDGWITSHENYVIERTGIYSSLIEIFIKSHYLREVNCPKTLVIDENLKEKDILEKALSKLHKTKVKIIIKPGKKDRGLLKICKSNTKLAFNKSSKEILDISSNLNSLKEFINLNYDIKLIESYDISHHSGKNAVAACVVYGKEGKIKQNYRMFNISKENEGNDIASMEEAIQRRFESKDLGLKKPDIILIDGGKAHLNAVSKMLSRIRVKDIEVIAVSKGVRRKADFDSLHRKDKQVIYLKGSVVHLFIQEIRDETHRFAISRLKKKQNKSSLGSSLDEIIGIGKEKKNNLLRHFGSFEQIKKASFEDFLIVPGIGKETAQTLSRHLS